MYETNLGEKGEKREEKYCCKKCDYNTSVKFSYDRHTLTSKHLKMVKNVKNETNETKKEKKEKKENMTCECGEVYYSRTTLWRHKKICSLIENLVVQPDQTNKKDELIDYLMKENKEIKELILELVEIKDYYWPIGTHYYSPLSNKYENREEFIHKAQNPEKGILVVGEVVSDNQGWTNGALSSVKAVLNKKWIKSVC